MTTDSENDLTNILFVDDHDETRQLVEDMLERRGYMVDTSPSPDLETALAYDVVISDYYLASDDPATGDAFYDQLQDAGYAGGFIVCSGREPEADYGFPYLMKPVDWEELVSHVEEGLRLQDGYGSGEGSAASD